MPRCPICPYQCGSIAQMTQHILFCQSRVDRAKRIKRERRVKKETV